MNKVDYLLKNPFHVLKIEEKIEIKRLGAHQPNDFTCVQVDGKKKRTFCNTWFGKKAWLTVSEEKQSIFCFYCLLFGGEGLWTTIGCRDLKHFSERIKKHEESAHHLENACKFKIFGTVNIAAQIDSAHKISIKKHNELVTKNRHILNRVIECLKFCGIHELALRGHSETQESANRGNFLDLLSLLGNLDSVLDDHLNSTSVFKYTSHIIQNELLDCMYKVYIEELINDIKAANYVSLQADETTDISCRSQFVIILRYIKGYKPVERFLSFEAVRDRTATGLSEVLKKTLQPFNVEKKLIAQTYDGAAVMSGNQGGVQTLMQNIFPYAKYVHCYAHQLNLVIRNACWNIKSVKLFFANITGFTTFFSTSPKRSDLLRSVCNKRIPTVSTTRWNFQSRVVNSVHENKSDLFECFEKIEEDDEWDDITVRQAFGLKNLLNNPGFSFFLNFFYDIMKHVDILYNTIQMQSANTVTISNALQHFESAVSEIRQNTGRYQVDEDICSAPSTKRLKQGSEENLTADAKEVCDIVINQLKGRFKESQIFSSFEIIDPKKFSTFRENFPANLVSTFASSYSPFICKEKLKNELSVIYRNDTFKDIPSVCDLFIFFMSNSFEESFSEVHKTLQIALTTPVSTAEAERCFSTLKRIKTFLRNSMGQDRLNSLAVCSVHKEEIGEIRNFNNRVIDMFASQKNRRAQLLYK
jgi:hypothetical protein